VQRADRIGLVIAAILVVILAAGTTALMVKRANTLANERPVDGTVKLTTIEDSETPAPKATGVVSAKPTVQRQPKGSDFGYITKVTGSGSSLHVTYDPAELLTGKEADLYALKSGKAINTELYYVANATHKLKTYPLSSKAQVVMASSDGATSTVTLQDLQSGFGKGGTLFKATWWVFIKGSTIVRLEQVVLPPRV
jgi:hypothetical protein